jgi:hypothetical protein
VLPDVVPEVEPDVEPEVEPLVEPAFSDAVQAPRMASDEHRAAQVNPERSLLFIRLWKSGRKNCSLRPPYYTWVLSAIYP